MRVRKSCGNSAEKIYSSAWTRYFHFYHLHFVQNYVYNFDPMTSSLSFDSTALAILWQEVCTELAESTSPFLANAWAKTATLAQIETDNDDWQCVLQFPSSFNALQFEKDLLSPAAVALSKKLSHPANVKIDVAPAPTTPPPSLQPTTALSRPSKKTPDPTTEGGLFNSSVINEVMNQRAALTARHIGLRPEFTFQTFAVSNSNDMAHSAALAVANKPGANYNPLFLYGNVGVGKTHLMHAIGNHVLSQEPEAKVVYCTCEEFTNEIILAMQKKGLATHTFKEKYRNCKALLIDDIQFLSKTNSVQEEFFHTFNALVGRHSQIVMTSDRPPHEIPLLADRLRSRFEAGMVIDIQQPSFELRTAILLIKANSAQLQLPMELAQMVAARIDSTRKIEGFLTRLHSETELKGRLIDQALIERLLQDEKRTQIATVRQTPSEVLNAVANHFKIKQVVIKGLSRQKEIILARHIAMFLFKTELNLSYVEIGRWFGGRDHTSVMHGVNKIGQLLRPGSAIEQDLLAIKTTLAGA